MNRHVIQMLDTGSTAEGGALEADRAALRAAFQQRPADFGRSLQPPGHAAHLAAPHLTTGTLLGHVVPGTLKLPLFPTVVDCLCLPSLCLAQLAAPLWANRPQPTASVIYVIFYVLMLNTPSGVNAVRLQVEDKSNWCHHPMTSDTCTVYS